MAKQTVIKRALLSVSNKAGLVELAQQLHQLGIELIATGGTAGLLQKNAIPITEISDYTGFPEIMGGRVKTLHPKIYGGLLGRRDQDTAIMQTHDIPDIDLVIVNLYPFAETIAKKDSTREQAIEQIDIGGPSMLRAAAKNHQDVTVVVDPDDYPALLQALHKEKATDLYFRQQLAQKVFVHTSEYDRLIANYLQENSENDQVIYQPSFILKETLRYGENPHQQAKLYQLPEASSATLASTKTLQGKSLSYNNMIDADCALSLAQSLDNNQAACVIVKHATPCGVAQGNTLVEAYRKAYASDSESAFGGTIAINRWIDDDFVAAIKSHFVEVLIATGITSTAKTLLAKKTNLRVLIIEQNTPPNEKSYHSISGGLLVQDKDQRTINAEDLTVVTEKQPEPSQIADLLFAWRVVKFTKSNAIVFAKDQATVGIGCGQTSRVFAAKIAILRAQAANLSLPGSVLASDAFFPFADSIEVAATNGITAIIQPGGSKRDDEVIAAANAAGITMMFTGIRHFRH